MEATALRPKVEPSSPRQREEKRITGSGTGSSDNDSLASEVGRLSEENAHLSRKITEMMGKTPATPSSTRSGSGHFSGTSGERMRDQVRKLERDNRRLQEQNSALERRLASGKVSASADELWRLKEDNRTLRSENAQLSSEIEQLNKVASYVGNRVAKVLVGARRANNYNSQLVGELKRWNRRLEDENHRLYNIIDRLQNTRPGSETANAVASEASALSSSHDRGRAGNAKLVKQLEDENVKLQEEISKLSDHAISLQNLSSSSGSSGSSGILPAPRTPSNHEQEGTGPRRTLTPDHEARKVAERLRGVEAERRKARNMSVESLTASETGEDVERLKNENKKYAAEIERIGADLAFVRNQVVLSQELKDSNAQQTIEIQKLTEAAARVEGLEEANATQAVEIERLLDAQTKLEQEAKTARELQEDNAQMEEDIFKLADEVERLQPFADQVAELEARIAAYQRELDEHATLQNSNELARLKEENVEVQRTLEAMAAEKAVLQAQVRELLEERAQLQSHNKDLDFRARQLQEQAASAASLKAELTGMSQVKGQSAAYRAQVASLRNENEGLARKVSDLASQLAAAQEVSNSGMVRGQSSEDHSELRDLRCENQNLARELQSHSSELCAVRNDNDDLSKEVEDLGSELASKCSENEKLSQQLEANSVEMITLRKEKLNLAKKLDTHSAELEALRQENERRARELATLEAECQELTSQLQQLQTSGKVDSKELEALRAENKELSAKASSTVLMTVELTTLRNQVADYRKMEEQLEEQQAVVRQLKNEKAAVQQEANSLPSLKAEIASLQAKVVKAEQAQKASEAALAGLSSTSLAKQEVMYKQNQEREQEIVALRKQHTSTCQELAEREQQLADLEAEHDSLTTSSKQQALHTQQNTREVESVRSEVTALRLALEQERSRNSGVSEEAAELHALLETAKAERTSQQEAVNELRAENADLLRRIGDLATQNEEQEKTLAAVLSRNKMFTAGPRPTNHKNSELSRSAPVAAVENPSFSLKPQEKQSVASQSSRHTEGSEDGWRSPASPGSPVRGGSTEFRIVENGPMMEEPRPTKNGRTAGKRLGKLFSLGGRKKSSPIASAEKREVPAVPATPDVAVSESMMERLAAQQVISAYELFVDKDDIDGFMASLDFKGFKGPTHQDDMEGAFVSAKYACRPGATVGSSEREKALSRATYELLEAWHGAWLSAFEE